MNRTIDQFKVFVISSTIAFFIILILICVSYIYIIKMQKEQITFTEMSRWFCYNEVITDYKYLLREEEIWHRIVDITDDYGARNKWEATRKDRIAAEKRFVESIKECKTADYFKIINQNIREIK